MIAAGALSELFNLAWNNGIWLLLALVLGLLVGWAAFDVGEADERPVGRSRGG